MQRSSLLIRLAAVAAAVGVLGLAGAPRPAYAWWSHDGWHDGGWHDGGWHDGGWHDGGRRDYGWRARFAWGPYGWSPPPLVSNFGWWGSECCWAPPAQVAIVAPPPVYVPHKVQGGPAPHHKVAYTRPLGTYTPGPVAATPAAPRVERPAAASAPGAPSSAYYPPHD